LPSSSQRNETDVCRLNDQGCGQRAASAQAADGATGIIVEGAHHRIVTHTPRSQYPMLAFAALIALTLAVVRIHGQWRSRQHRTRGWFLAWLPPLGFLGAVAWAVAIDVPTHKMVFGLVMPAGLLLIGLIALTLWLWSRQRTGALMAGALALGFMVLGNVWFSAWLMGRLQNSIPQDDPLKRPTYDAVLVLGGGSSADLAGNPSFGTSGDRIAVAARLWLAGRVRVLVASGSAIPELTGPRDLAADTVTLWQSLGVPEEAMIAAPGPRTTSEEMRVYAELIRSHGWQRVGLVTSAWHLPRALRLARKNGLDLDPIAADWKGSSQEGWAAYNLVPRESALLDTRLAAWELLGAALGR